MTAQGQFYTAPLVSKLLIASIQQEQANHVLDLGVGKGVLLGAALRRWKSARFYAADIDKSNVAEISKRFPSVRTFHIDGLSDKLSRDMSLRVGSIDIAVCNPPYFRLKRGLDLSAMLRRAELKRSPKLPRVTSDVLFLAQNLQMLRSGGELGIILPDGVFTSHEFILLREDLLSDHEILGLIQLPDDIFPKTEARAHILLLRKGGSSRQMIPLFRASPCGKIEDALEIPSSSIVHRMDHVYHCWKSLQTPRESAVTLEELGVDIKRGRKQRKVLSDLGIPYFHTTSFPDDLHARVDLPCDFPRDDTLAESGDILVARVGKRCIGKVTMVRSGRRVISDCVYRIRSRKYGMEVWRALISRRGQDWLKAHAHGVCSRVISKRDLLTFEVCLS